jgi:hypothetical protein
MTATNKTAPAPAADLQCLADMAKLLGEHSRTAHVSSPVHVTKAEFDALQTQCASDVSLSASIYGVSISVLPDGQVHAVRNMVTAAKHLFGRTLSEREALRVLGGKFGGV